MLILPVLLSLILSPALAGVAPPEEPLACRLDALTAAQRARHRSLSETLARAIQETRELPNGYELVLDLTRLPADAHGDPVCVVEVADWVDLEARCCPFLDFGIDVRGKGGAVRLALTGGEGVKAFLRTEFPMLERRGD